VAFAWLACASCTGELVFDDEAATSREGTSCSNDDAGEVQRVEWNELIFVRRTESDAFVMTADRYGSGRGVIAHVPELSSSWSWSDCVARKQMQAVSAEPIDGWVPPRVLRDQGALSGAWALHDGAARRPSLPRGVALRIEHRSIGAAVPPYRSSRWDPC